MIYIIDNDLNSLYSAIFLAYSEKQFNVKVYSKNAQLTLFDEVKKVKTDTEKAKRVETLLKKILKGNYSDIKLAFRSGLGDKNSIIFNYLIETINANKDISENFSNTSVLEFYEIVNKVKKEIHHLKGFIRFSKTNNGIYYAKFLPDNDVCDLILPHFKARYKSMPFILHDYKFNKLCAYNGKDSKIVNKKISPLTVSDDINLLFKTYYDSVNIIDRKNLRLMKNYLPKRYHVNMPEKNELL
ncbi:MAG: TIGR03915 family putative DNA repair protein [Clostridia bacterium]|nr:TIGR03915 family putative DNA repair protein [Clostridia bacterium]